MIFFSLIPPPPRSTLFPYTTLFRSLDTDEHHRERHGPRLAHRHARADHEPEHDRQRIEREAAPRQSRSEEHTSELQSRENLVCRLLLEKKKRIVGLETHSD